MITEIAINKFRCFRNSRISGFKAVNLIGGKNNSGKTALLEAIYLNLSPSASTIQFLNQCRGESSEFAKIMPDRAWNNLFFNLNNKEELSIISYDSTGSRSNIELSCDKSTDQFSRVFEEERQLEGVLVDLRVLPSGGDFKRSTLNIDLIKPDGERLSLVSLIAHSKGVYVKELTFPDGRKPHYVPAALRSANEVLAREYDMVDMAGNSQKVFNAIKTIEGSLTGIKTFNIGKAGIYLKKSQDDYLPIHMFGEATRRTVAFILKIVNNPCSVLLIDEIENGIHYSSQCELWKNIFELSLLFDVQIFATTHSYEMMQAFADAGLSKDDFKGNASYLEIVKSIQSGEIIGIPRDLEALKYAIDRKMGVRGE